MRRIHETPLVEFCWKGETLYARNHAVGDSYLFQFGCYLGAPLRHP